MSVRALSRWRQVESSMWGPYPEEDNAIHWIPTRFSSTETNQSSVVCFPRSRERETRRVRSDLRLCCRLKRARLLIPAPSARAPDRRYQSRPRLAFKRAVRRARVNFHTKPGRFGYDMRASGRALNDAHRHNCGYQSSTGSCNGPIKVINTPPVFPHGEWYGSQNSKILFPPQISLNISN